MCADSVWVAGLSGIWQVAMEKLPPWLDLAITLAQPITLDQTFTKDQGVTLTWYRCRWPVRYPLLKICSPGGSCRPKTTCTRSQLLMHPETLFISPSKAAQRTITHPPKNTADSAQTKHLCFGTVFPLSGVPTLWRARRDKWGKNNQK